MRERPSDVAVEECTLEIFLKLRGLGYKETNKGEKKINNEYTQTIM
jgi:hypothetical protein